MYAIGAYAIGAYVFGAYAIGVYVFGAYVFGAYAFGAYAIGAYVFGAYAIRPYGGIVWLFPFFFNFVLTIQKYIFLITYTFSSENFFFVIHAIYN